MAKTHSPSIKQQSTQRTHDQKTHEWLTDIFDAPSADEMLLTTLCRELEQRYHLEIKMAQKMALDLMETMELLNIPALRFSECYQEQEWIQ